MKQIKKYIKSWRISEGDYDIWPGEVLALSVLHLIVLFALLITYKVLTTAF